MRVCLSTTHLVWNTTLGGHAWVFLNWVLGLQDAGARVVILEKLRFADDPGRLLAHLRSLRSQLAALGVDADLALLASDEQRAQLAHVRAAFEELTVPVEQVQDEADLLLNFKYAVPQGVVDGFARTALVDIDPGLLQHWMHSGAVRPAVHDMNFTIGETVGRPGARFPDAGLAWHYTPPPVHLPSWPVTAAEPTAPFTTVTNWWGEYEWIDGVNVNNEKRTHFLACLDLPGRTRAPIELAIYHEPGNPSDFALLETHGWRTRPAYEVSTHAADYRAYLQRSRGEFSCAKESCMVFQNAWLSDRTICYLASGKPAVVQHTGASRFLPDAEGLFRFRNAEEAARCLDLLCDEDEYHRHARAARALCEEHFDAADVMRRLLETALAEPVGRRRFAHGR